MALTSLLDWRTVRLDRIDQLIAAHSRIEGTSSNTRGRRWRTAQFNRLLVIALVAEFQGWARDLHDASATEFVRRSVTAGSTVEAVFRGALTFNRRLDRANPDKDSLAEDFGRFGLDLWATMQKRHTLTGSRQGHLSRIVKARNGIAHADESKIAQLRAEGFPITLKTVERWRSALNGLANTMDSVMSDQIVVVHGGPRPW